MEGRRKRKMIMNRNKTKEEKKIQKIIDAQELLNKERKQTDAWRNAQG